MTAISGLSANRRGAFRARDMQQFHVTMRRCAMILSLADDTGATARGVAVIAASPVLFQAQSRTPHQIELANVFCRCLEMARPI